MSDDDKAKEHSDRHFAELLQALSAFIPSSRQPDRIAIDVIDDEGTSEFFGERSLESITPLDARRRASSLWYFTPEAFVYFAYPFLLDIATAGMSDTVVIGHLLAQFPSTGDDSRIDRGRRIIELMTTKQLRALIYVITPFARCFDDVAVYELLARLKARAIALESSGGCDS